MPEEFTIVADVNKVTDALKTIPENANKEVLKIMQMIMGRLEDTVKDNIETDFMKGLRPDKTEEGRRARLKDAPVSIVTQEGDLTIGQLSISSQEVPYARILEEGGVIPAHVIRPRSGRHAMAIPLQSFKSFQLGEMEHIISDFILATEVDHPGAQIVGTHYMARAFVDLARTFENDIEGAIAKAINASGLDEQG